MNKSKIIFKRNPAYSRCPSCNQSNTLHRSRARNLKEDIIKRFTFFKIYRCRNCGWRGYLSTLKLTLSSMKYSIFYMLLLIVVVIFVNKILSLVAK
ncbi:MAG: hypothetical protein ACYDA4_14805 [Ignavibacteriaceae bacterium]